MRERHLLLALMFVGSCSSLSSHGDNPGEADVAVQRAALSPSPSLPAAVAGRIVSPTSFVVSAGIPGEPSAGHDGTATYRLPLWVPEGINGLQPNLVIEYNSEAATGILGPHWRLAGLSVINRCPRTLAQDETRAPVDFLGSTFCLDGQRLVVVGSTPGYLEFRTERESFSKIYGYRDGNGDVTSFTVWQRDGLVLSFGTTLSSRLHGNPRRLDGTFERDVSYAYYVDKIEDRYGNAIKVTYQNAESSPTTSDSEVTELVPHTMSWGPGEKRSVTFSFYQALNPKVTRSVSGLSIVASQPLAEIEVRGPDGQGGTPILRAYGFEYATKWPSNSPTIITGDQVLAHILERDAGWFVKRTTDISWESGSVAHTRVELDSTNATDFRSSQYTGSAYVPAGEPQTTNYARLYRRIIATDLNGDGRDDIVHRGFMGAEFGGSGQKCVGWWARYTQLDGTGRPTLSPATKLPLGSDPDTACRAAAFDSSTTHYAGGNAWPGDVIFADLNNDGYPDIVSPIGRSSGFNAQGQQTNKLAGYRAYLNEASSPGTFGYPINFLDSVGVFPSLVDFNALPFSRFVPISIGDVSGDGIPEILRWDSERRIRVASPGMGGLTSMAERRGGRTFRFLECPSSSANCNSIFALSQFDDFDVVDLDGDGTSEVISSSARCPAFLCPTVSVKSPTMNGELSLGPAQAAFAGGSSPARLFPDLNADGLADVVWLDGNNWRASINTGRGFAADTSTPIPTSMVSGSGWAQVLPIDFNLDGRQDLLVNAATTSGKSSVLISDGTGGFVREEHPIPPAPLDKFTGRVDRIVADLNGDGLPDIVQLEAGKLVAHVRQGKAPAMVTRIAEGNGRTIDFAYAVANGRDTNFYNLGVAPSCQSAPDRLACLNRARWLVQTMTVSGGGRLEQQSFRYEGGVFDKKGLGFLGFARRTVEGPGPRRTDFTYAPSDRIVRPGSQVYAYHLGMSPQTVYTCVSTAQSTNSISCERKQDQASASWQNDGTYRVFPSTSSISRSDCPASHGAVCSDTGSGYRKLSVEDHAFTFDSFANLANHVTRYHHFPNGALVLQRTDTEAHNYLPANTGAWLISLLDPDRPSTIKSETTSPPETVTRTTKYHPDLEHGGIVAMEIEPNGDASTNLYRSFSRDDRGRLRWVREFESSGLSRTTVALEYQEDANDDGVYPWKVKNAMQRETTVRRHPGLGLVVEVVDPNGIAAARTYDTFGRLRSETDFSGAFTKLSYPDTASAGADVWVEPEGLASRRIQIRLDAFGQETNRDIPVNANRRVRTGNTYDQLGRLQTRVVDSVDAGGVFLRRFNTFTFSYDGLDRPTSRSGVTSDGSTRTAMSTYDGFQVTSINEAGRAVTQIFDSFGRLATERATLDVDGVATVSDSTYTYGAFGLLKEQKTVGATGKTSFLYDILGRQTLVTRAGAGTRGAHYNAYGDVTASYKLEGKGLETERVDYGRDSLGRLTSITAPNVPDRAFYWDAPASNLGTPAPGAIGKLVDIKGGGVDVHYDYYDVSSPGSGLLRKKTWVGGPSWQAPATIGSAEYTYDAQGRVATLKYPKFETWSFPLTVNYEYNQHSGRLRAIRDATNLTVPLWEATAENDLGQTTTERLQMPSSPLQQRLTSYYETTGLLKTASLLSSASSQYDIGYTYGQDGLPTKYNDGARSDVFGYDNLGRMTSWQPSLTSDVGPTVAYRYDRDGNLTYRGWSGNVVTYSEDATSRTVTQGSTASTYRKDVYGRIFDTPAVTVDYNALDEITRITTKSASRNTAFHRDAFGERLVTEYGTPSDGQPWWVTYTLDDLAELRTASTGTEERLRLRDGDGRLIGELVRTAPGTATRTATFFLTNNVGSVAAELSSSGVITKRTRRDPFGNRVPSEASPTLGSDPAGSEPEGTSRMAFADHARDTGWGLVDMGARLYNPRLGRFLSPDPIIANVLDRRDHNPFAYAHNMPTAARDPDGRGVEVAGAVAGVVTAVGATGIVAVTACYFFCDDAVNALSKSKDWVGNKLGAAWDWATGGGGDSQPPPAPKVAAASLPAAQASSSTPASASTPNTGTRSGGSILTIAGPGTAIAPVGSDGEVRADLFKHLRPLQPIGTIPLPKPEVMMGVVPFGGGLGTARGAMLAAKTGPALLNPLRSFAEGQLEKHFVKHAAEWGAGNVTKAAYLKRAQNLLSRDVGGSILGRVRANGDILRYNMRTNELAIGTADGTIRTLFRPIDGLSYWLKQVF